ncbi:hypothetical protein EDEG_00197 [Edhazardia aedis USNM 41457]|uniref:Uncharacterized protein n=1 Tax=Edhazardia aedis (strain USNM 41457) TaxID=1003232 RepID=J9DLP8_EDHAE|nr:hypothetical protein EDEG_00197 [Edhazardia aedis USNM 41457]|eukprot:EJW03515.1 hypothetical protein EDEG_00197 [Edhazardia aedis USNM 41457]
MNIILKYLYIKYEIFLMKTTYLVYVKIVLHVFAGEKIKFAVLVFGGNPFFIKFIAITLHLISKKKEIIKYKSKRNYWFVYFGFITYNSCLIGDFFLFFYYKFPIL